MPVHPRWRGEQIRGWKVEREQDLNARLKRLAGYLSRYNYTGTDKATQKAERTLRQQQPERAQLVERARQLEREQKTAQIKRQFEQKRSRERGDKSRGRG